MYRDAREIILIAVFALAWFIVGIFSGYKLQRRTVTRKRKHSLGKRSNNSHNVEIYVGNLSYSVSDNDLIRAFEKFGKVISARIIKNGFNGRSKGFGFVEMSNRYQSSDAISRLNGKDLKGRKIIVNEAKSRSSRYD